MKKFSDFCTRTVAMGTCVGAFTNTNKKKVQKPTYRSYSPSQERMEKPKWEGFVSGHIWRLKQLWVLNPGFWALSQRGQHPVSWKNDQRATCKPFRPFFRMENIISLPNCLFVHLLSVECESQMFLTKPNLSDSYAHLSKYAKPF